MIRRLLFKSRHGSYLRNEHGIKKFAEREMGQLIRKVTKKSAFYREMNENLMVEKANLRMRAEELSEEPMLKAGEFFSVRRRLWANAFIVTAVVVAAVFLFFVSITSFINAETGVVGFLRWAVAGVLALVLAGGGLVVTERLIEAVMGPTPTRVQEDTNSGTGISVLWGVLLFAIELSILGIVEVRADRLALSQESQIVYYGFILLTMLLPVIAGAVRWDAMRYLNAYKVTRAHRQIDSRLAQIDSILRQNEEYESNYYKINLIEYWDEVNEFKTNKDLYNEKHGYVERLDDHFARTYDAFQSEAHKRYESDIRDLTSKSMRKLETSGGTRGRAADGAPAGRKLGQQPTDGAKIERAPMPAASSSDERNGRSGGDEAAVEESDVYLRPKPIR